MLTDGETPMAAHDPTEDAMLLAVDSLETSALTKAQLAELLFEQIGLTSAKPRTWSTRFSNSSCST